jgi:hypothetical protein
MAQREQVFVGQPSIFGGARLLPSPSQFFLTGEDKLRVVSANSLVGVSLKVQWRTATLAGDVVPSSQDHTPNSDRTVNRQDYELGSGSLLNVTVFASAGAPLSGQTFVIVQLVRGDGPAAIVLGTLLAGYVTAVQALGFPGSPIASSTDGHGAIRTIIGTSPAAGVECAEVVPTGARWELVSFVATIVTSATVITRVPELYVDMAGSNFLRRASVSRRDRQFDDYVHMGCRVLRCRRRGRHREIRRVSDPVSAARGLHAAYLHREHPAGRSLDRGRVFRA